MSKLLLSSSLLFCSWAAFAQGGPASHVITGPTLPTKCNPLSGDVWFLTTGTPTGALYNCTGTNTWSVVATGTSGSVYVSSLTAGPDTTKTITGGTHGFATTGLWVWAFDNSTPRNSIAVGFTVNPSTFDVVVTFSLPQSNYYIIINGGGIGPIGPTGSTGVNGSGNNTLCTDASGSTTTYTCPTPNPNVPNLNGLLVTFVPQTTNTASSTLNVQGLGAKTIKLSDGSTNLSSGALVGGTSYILAYDGTNFRQTSSAVTGFKFECLVTNASVTVVNQASLTDLQTCTIPANELGANQIIDFIGSGFYSGTNPRICFQYNLGSTGFAAACNTLTTIAGKQTWEFHVQCSTAAAPSGSSTVFCSAATNGGALSATPWEQYENETTGSSAYATNGSLVFKAQVQVTAGTATIVQTQLRGIRYN